MQLSPSRHVFVYGTLRRGEQRDINLLRPAPCWVGLASVPGLLYDLGAYPGMRVGEGADTRCHVHGEVYAISPELERQLDEIEEVWPQQSGEYVKREVMVWAQDFAGDAHDGVSCLVYEISYLCVQGKPQIASGDWLQHRRGSVT